MSDNTNTVDQFEEGDEFALSPSEQSRVISRILAAGGAFELDGSTVRVTALPKASVVPPKAKVVPTEPPAEPAPVPEPDPEPAPEKPARAPRKAKAETAEAALPEPDKE